MQIIELVTTVLKAARDSGLDSEAQVAALEAAGTILVAQECVIESSEPEASMVSKN